MRIAVIDDNDREREVTLKAIHDYAISRNIDFETEVYCSAEQFVEKYEKGKYKVIFSDIEMSKMDGMVIGQYIRNASDYDTQIVYITNYPEYMRESFDVMAAQFFSKPLDYMTFATKMDIVMRSVWEKEKNHIVIKVANDDVIVKLSDIMAIETVKNYNNSGRLVFRLDKEEIYARGRIMDYGNMCEGFIFINRSILLNMRRISIIQGQEVVMDNGRRYSISRGKAKKLKEEYISLLNRKFEEQRSHHNREEIPERK